MSNSIQLYLRFSSVNTGDVDPTAADGPMSFRGPSGDHHCFTPQRVKVGEVKRRGSIEYNCSIMQATFAFLNSECNGSIVYCI